MLRCLFLAKIKKEDVVYLSNMKSCHIKEDSSGTQKFCFSFWLSRSSRKEMKCAPQHFGFYRKKVTIAKFFSLHTPSLHIEKTLHCHPKPVSGALFCA